MTTNTDYQLSWSLNEEYIYLDDNGADEREITIHFVGDRSKKQTKEVKKKILEEIIKNL